MAGSQLWPTGERVIDPTTGAPLSGATLETFITGTTTQKTTFSDKALTIANPNPLTSNAAGLWEVSSVRVDVWGSGGYKFVLKNSAGTTLGTYDPVDDVVTSVAATGDNAKTSVRATTTANITLSGAQTIDGVSIVAGDRVLVKDQTDASENGIYDANASAWTRSADMNENLEAAGFWVAVREGTLGAKLVFGLTTDGAITLDTTNMTIEQLSDPTSEIDTEKKDTRGRSNKTDAYELVADDAGKTVSLSGSSTKAFTLTVGTFSTDEYGFLEQLGTGQLTLTAGSGTTLRFHSDFQAQARGQWSTLGWTKINSTQILLVGDLDPV